MVDFANVRRQRFCYEFVKNGGSAARAATAVGYTSANEGARLIKDHKIQEQIQRIIDTELAVHGFDRHRYIAELSAAAGLEPDGTTHSVVDLFERSPVTEDGGGGELRLRDPDTFTRAERMMIKSIKVQRVHKRDAVLETISVDTYDRVNIMRDLALVLKIVKPEETDNPDNTARRIRDMVRAIKQRENGADVPATSH